MLISIWSVSGEESWQSLGFSIGSKLYDWIQRMGLATKLHFPFYYFLTVKYPWGLNSVTFLDFPKDIEIVFKTRSNFFSNDSSVNQEKLFFNTQVSIYQLKGPSLDSSKRAILSFQVERCPRYERRKGDMSRHAENWNFLFFREKIFFKKIWTYH